MMMLSKNILYQSKIDLQSWCGAVDTHALDLVQNQSDLLGFLKILHFLLALQLTYAVSETFKFRSAQTKPDSDFKSTKNEDTWNFC